MPVEIERKFLVVGDGWRIGAAGQRFCQGYLASEEGVTVRVRRAGPEAYITIKGEPNGIVRPEYEYPVPVDEAEAMLESLCRRPLIEKGDGRRRVASRTAARRGRPTRRPA